MSINEQLFCSEHDRMQRVEAKIDKVCDAITDIKVSLGKLEGTRDKLEIHDQEIQELKSKTRVYDALATRKSVIVSYLLAITALALSTFPWVQRIFEKGN